MRSVRPALKRVVPRAPRSACHRPARHRQGAGGRQAGGLLFEEGRRVGGRAPWPHKVSANGKILERFLSYAEAQGSIPQEYAGEARFAHTTRATSIPVGVM